MPQFLYRIQPTRPAMLTEGPTEREAQVIGEHFAYLSRLTDDGTVLMAGRTLNDDAGAFGVVVVVAASAADAATIMSQDPAVRHGVMQAALFPFRVALWSSTGPADEAG